MNCGRLLTYNPEKRMTAEDGKRHEFFSESPLPVDPATFPTWPAKSEQSKTRTHGNSPKLLVRLSLAAKGPCFADVTKQTC